MKNQEKIKNIYKEKVKKLFDFNRAYFEKDNPIVSDLEFDSLKTELVQLAKKYPFLKKIENLDNLILSRDVTISPIPSTYWVPPLIKKGTSLPIDDPIVISLSSDNFIFHRLFNAFNTVAALLLPPPSPEPIGIFFDK